MMIVYRYGHKGEPALVPVSEPLDSGAAYDLLVVKEGIQELIDGTESYTVKPIQNKWEGW